MLMRFKFSRHICKKHLNITFRENPFSGSLVIPFGRTYTQTVGHDDANSAFSQFRERAYKELLYAVCVMQVPTVI